MRTIIDLPEQQLKGLQQLADAQNASRAELVRQAVAEYLVRAQQRSQPHSVWDEAFGLWARDPIPSREDGLDYQQRIRDEWTERDNRVEARVQHAAQKKAIYMVGKTGEVVMSSSKRPARKKTS